MNVNDAQSSGLRIVLCTLNSKFSHTSLSLRLLRESCRPVIAEDDELILAEYTINDQPHQLLQRLYELKGDIYAFSCYIWNSRLIRQLIQELSCLRPETILIMGGPEAAWQQAELMNELSGVDFILAGEGELNLPPLLAGLSAGCDREELCSRISGIAWRDTDGKIRIDPAVDLDMDASWPFAYTEDELRQLSDRILYYESSRGCPFGCTYCMSSRDRRVRNRDITKVFTELNQFMAADVKLVKFVDRTFNCDSDRAFEIWQYLIKCCGENGCRTRFHFEIAADLLDDKAIDLLKTAPEGLFQFEIGVQTCSQEVLRQINRACDLDKLFLRCRQLREKGLIHQHLDLIAGLPGDDLEQMSASFDQVISLDPHMLQLGFLKVLPGSIISDQAQERGMLWRSSPPYEILRSDGMSFDDLLLLKRIENQLDRYYNNESFTLTISYLLMMADSAFSLFAAFAEVYCQLGWEEKAPGRNDVWELPLKLLESKAAENCFSINKPDHDLLRDCLIIDYVSSGQKDQPVWQRAFELSRSEEDLMITSKIRERNRQEYPKMRRIRVERFSGNPSSMIGLRELIRKHGLRYVIDSLNEEVDINSEKEKAIDDVVRLLLNDDHRDYHGWYSVIDMSSPMPELIWQIDCEDDIQTGRIIRRCISYNSNDE